MRALTLLLLLGASGASAQPLVARDAGAARGAARAVALDLAALGASADARTPVALDLFGERLVATPDRVERRGPGRFLWSATLAGGGRVTLTVSGAHVFGRVYAPRGSFVIEPRGGGHVLYRPAPDADDPDDAVVPRTGAARPVGTDVLFPDELPRRDVLHALRRRLARRRPRGVHAGHRGRALGRARELGRARAGAPRRGHAGELRRGGHPKPERPDVGRPVRLRGPVRRTDGRGPDRPRRRLGGPDDALHRGRLQLGDGLRHRLSAHRPDGPVVRVERLRRDQAELPVRVRVLARGRTQHRPPPRPLRHHRAGRVPLRLRHRQRGLARGRRAARLPDDPGLQPPLRRPRRHVRPHPVLLQPRLAVARAADGQRGHRQRPRRARHGRPRRRLPRAGPRAHCRRRDGRRDRPPAVPRPRRPEHVHGLARGGPVRRPHGPGHARRAVLRPARRRPPAPQSCCTAAPTTPRRRSRASSGMPRPTPTRPRRGACCSRPASTPGRRTRSSSPARRRPTPARSRPTCSARPAGR